MMKTGSGATTPAEAGLFALLEIVGDPALHKARLEQLVTARQEQVDAKAAADKAKAAADEALDSANKVIAESKAEQAKAQAAREGAEAEVAKQGRSLDAARAELTRDKEANDARSRDLDQRERLLKDREDGLVERNDVATKALNKREADIISKEGLAQTRLDEANALKAEYEGKLASLREKLAGV